MITRKRGPYRKWTIAQRFIAKTSAMNNLSLDEMNIIMKDAGFQPLTTGQYGHAKSDAKKIQCGVYSLI
jgi:hypothetical protein